MGKTTKTTAKKANKISRSDFLRAPFKVVLAPEGDGFLASYVEIESLMACGKNQLEAIKNLEAARGEWYDLAVEVGASIPEPASTIEDSYSGRFILRLNPILHKLLAERAAEEDISLNSLCARMLMEGIASKPDELKAAVAKQSAAIASLRKSINELSRQLAPSHSERAAEDSPPYHQAKPKRRSTARLK